MRICRRPRRMRICITVDFDALSGFLGTGHRAENTLTDYSSGMFGANVGVGRLLRLFAKHGISDKVTWFLPGHSIESYPQQTAEIVRSGAEIGLHGYSHESAYAMTVDQERDVFDKCIELVTSLKGGQHPRGYRAPLYKIRASTIQLLQQKGFLYDSSMNMHDSLPYFLKNPYVEEHLVVPDYSKPASTWMVPTPLPKQPEPGSSEAANALVEVPVSWYFEDMTPMIYYPYDGNSHGYVSADVIEKMWLDRFEWLWENESWVDEDPGLAYGSILPLVWHPDSAGRSHTIGMIDKLIGKLILKAEEAGENAITFETMEQAAYSWKNRPAKIYCP